MCTRCAVQRSGLSCLMTTSQAYLLLQVELPAQAEACAGRHHPIRSLAPGREGAAVLSLSQPLCASEPAPLSRCPPVSPQQHLQNASLSARSRHMPSLKLEYGRAGEVLGCTAPVLKQEVDAIVFVADGRFHLEAIMIANPTTPAYRSLPRKRLCSHDRWASSQSFLYCRNRL